MPEQCDVNIPETAAYDSCSDGQSGAIFAVLSLMDGH